MSHLVSASYPPLHSSPFTIPPLPSDALFSLPPHASRLLFSTLLSYLPSYCLSTPLFFAPLPYLSCPLLSSFSFLASPLPFSSPCHSSSFDSPPILSSSSPLFSSPHLLHLPSTLLYSFLSSNLMGASPLITLSQLWDWGIEASLCGAFLQFSRS